MPAGELGHTKSEQPVANHGLLFGGVHHDLLHSRHGSLKDPDGEHSGGSSIPPHHISPSGGSVSSLTDHRLNSNERRTSALGR